MTARWAPAALSLSRVPFAFALVLIYRPSQELLAGAIFLLAAVSDRLDGVLARRMGIASLRGYLLDGLGDRTFSIACLLVGMVHHGLPMWVLLLAVLRELLLYTTRLLDATWHPPKSGERSHSLLVFGVTRAWFVALLVLSVATDDPMGVLVLHSCLAIAVGVSTYLLLEKLVILILPCDDS